MPVSQTRAARALIAYFNHDLATKLVSRILKEKSSTAWKAMADKVLELVPDAAKDSVWKAVCDYTAKAGAEYVRSQEFLDKAQHVVTSNADFWVKQAFENEMKQKIATHLKTITEEYNMRQYIKDGPGRFRAEFDRELTRLAQEAAGKPASG